MAPPLPLAGLFLASCEPVGPSSSPNMSPSPSRPPKMSSSSSSSSLPLNGLLASSGTSSSSSSSSLRFFFFVLSFLSFVLFLSFFLFFLSACCCSPFVFLSFCWEESSDDATRSGLISAGSSMAGPERRGQSGTYTSGPATTRLNYMFETSDRFTNNTSDRICFCPSHCQWKADCHWQGFWVGKYQS